MEYIVPIAGILTSNGIFLAPLGAIHSLYSSPLPSAAAHSLNPISFALMPCNALTWIMYSLLPSMRNPFIFFGNCFGWLLSMFYLMVVFGAMPVQDYHPHPQGTNKFQSFVDSIARNKKRLIACLFLGGQLIILMSAFVSFVVLQQPAIGKLVMGSASITILIMFYAAPLSTLMQVLQTRNAASFAWPLLVACFVNALLWTWYGYYGLEEPDPFVWCPNLVGVLVSIVQTGCKLYFPSSESVKSTVGSPYRNLEEAAAAPETAVTIIDVNAESQGHTT